MKAPVNVKKLSSCLLLSFFPLFSPAVKPFIKFPPLNVSPLSGPVGHASRFVAPNPPVLHGDFSAIYDQNKVLLSWRTNGEASGDYFTVEKAKDGVHFSTALMVKSAGQYATGFEYRDIDYAPLTGVSYYRLKKTDHDGKASYSPVVPVNFQFARDGSLVAATGKSPDEEQLKKVERKEVLVLVRDASGNEFSAKVKVTKEQDEKLYAQDAQNNLGKGSYIVLASSFNALYSQRLIVK